jgi:hypothetical protein
LGYTKGGKNTKSEACAYTRTCFDFITTKLVFPYVDMVKIDQYNGAYPVVFQYEILGQVVFKDIIITQNFSII